MKLQEVKRRGKEKVKTFFGYVRKMSSREKKIWISAIGAPILGVLWFWGIAPMLPVGDPFDHSAKLCRIDVYGASKENPAQTREAFARAFADCAPGGTVVVPWGTWKTGGISIPSDATLYMNLGSTLSFSDDPNLYLPAVATRWEGMDVMNYQPFIYIPNAKNVAILGHGKVYGNGEKWWEWKTGRRGENGELNAAKKLYELTKENAPLSERYFGNEKNPLRPSFVQLYESDTIVIDGPKFVDGPMWTIHPVYSKNITIQNVKINSTGPNTDGIAIDSSENVLVSGCTIGSGDDAIVIKSGLDWDGWRQNRPAKHIVIRDTKIIRGNGGVTIGSEMSGGVEDVWVKDMVFRNIDTGIRLKTLKGRGGYVRNVRYEDIDMRGITEDAIQLDLQYKYATLKNKGDRIPTVKDIFFRDIFVRKTHQAFRIGGMKEALVENITMERGSFFVDTPGRANDISHSVFRNVLVSAKNGKPIEMKNVKDIIISGYFPRGARGEAFVKFQGVYVEDVTMDLFPCLRNACAIWDAKVPVWAVQFK